MAARSSWKGYLKLSLVSVPVKAYTAAASGGGEIQLNQLHADCNSRIQYKKSCPLHGEVKGDHIVSGYEYSKGQYVIVDTSELEKLRTEDDKAIKIDAFVPADTIDPAYFSGKNYYLVPEGPVGQRPFAVVCQGMIDEDCCGVAQVVLHSREQLVVLRPVDNLLVMSILNYDHQVTKPTAFAEEAPKMAIEPEELKLVKMLIHASKPKKFDFTKYQDATWRPLIPAGHLLLPGMCPPAGLPRGQRRPAAVPPPARRSASSRSFGT
jgi:DNA end-binding protein Ku